MSEHLTRTIVQSGKSNSRGELRRRVAGFWCLQRGIQSAHLTPPGPPISIPVYGALLGTQAGRTIEIQTTFELLMTEDKVDHGLLRDRQSQCKYAGKLMFVLWCSPSDRSVQMLILGMS